jgi:hypothetical protein
MRTDDIVITGVIAGRALENHFTDTSLIETATCPG